MLIACHDCHRQYDITTLAVGAKVRCLCGLLLEVPEVKPRDMEMLRCASCGGQLEKSDKDCGFCGSAIDLAERGLGSTCPECFARMAKNAEFCSTCGIGINPIGKLQPLHDKLCPRCEAPLAIQEFDNGSIVECTGCGGVWLEEKVFANITKNADAHAVATYVKGRAEASEGADLQPESSVRYLKCPTCQNMMHRKNYAGGSGVIIDWCRGHGYWFDRHELENILNFISDGGLDRARDRDRMEQTFDERRADRRREAANFDATPFKSRRRMTAGGSLMDALGGFLGGILS